MSENDVTRNSPGEMEQHNNLPESPPKNSSSSDAGPSICGIRDRATEQSKAYHNKLKKTTILHYL